MAKKLLPGDLRWSCDPAAFPFKTTAELPVFGEIIGQDRALKSIEFGLGITNHNYNIYVLGEGGTGKFTTVKTIIDEKARRSLCPTTGAMSTTSRTQTAPPP